MTEQEAIEYFKTGIEERKKNNMALFTISALELAISALEKQIPKKWEYAEVNDCDIYVCPCCKEYWYLEGMNPTQSEYNYCPNCGQALEWE